MTRNQTILAILGIAVASLLVHWHIHTSAEHADLRHSAQISEQLASLRAQILPLGPTLDTLREDVQLLKAERGIAPTAAAPSPMSFTDSFTQTVQVGSERRAELARLPALRTSELAEMLGRTNETVTDAIEHDPDTGAMWWPYRGRRYSVTRSGNTFLYQNPFAGNGE